MAYFSFPPTGKVSSHIIFSPTWVKDQDEGIELPVKLLHWKVCSFSLTFTGNHCIYRYMFIDIYREGSVGQCTAMVCEKNINGKWACAERGFISKWKTSTRRGVICRKEMEFGEMCRLHPTTRSRNIWQKIWINKSEESFKSAAQMINTVVD